MAGWLGISPRFKSGYYPNSRGEIGCRNTDNVSVFVSRLVAESILS